MKRFMLVLAVFAIAGCGAKVKSPSTNGPNYSTTPCADNCGADATCAANCTPVSNTSMPPGQFGK